MDISSTSQLWELAASFNRLSVSLVVKHSWEKWRAQLDEFITAIVEYGIEIVA
jgi:hypothetical protein